MMLHGVLSVEKPACEDISHGYGRKYSLERQEKDILAMG